MRLFKSPGSQSGDLGQALRTDYVFQAVGSAAVLPLAPASFNSAAAGDLGRSTGPVGSAGVSAVAVPGLGLISMALRVSELR